MTANLVIWKWDSAFGTAAKRRKQNLKNCDVAIALLHEEMHFADAPFDQQQLLEAIDAMYPTPEEDRAFVIRPHDRSPKAP